MLGCDYQYRDTICCHNTEQNPCISGDHAVCLYFGRFIMRSLDMHNIIAMHLFKRMGEETGKGRNRGRTIVNMTHSWKTPREAVDKAWKVRPSLSTKP